MSRIVFWLLLFLLLEIFLTWSNFFQKFRMEDQDFIARGNRNAWINKRSEPLKPQDTISINFSFICENVDSGNAAFGYFLAETDSGLRVIEMSKTFSNDRIILETTHIFDSNPVARGWTLKNIFPGDTAFWSAVLVMDTYPQMPERFMKNGDDKGFIYIRYGMEKDKSEIESDATDTREKIKIR
ncbi:MAG: hypothetical protein AUJ18_09275 [Candidatus Hydrogenedentes bacterium CG1_02_42_14]|nr:MAG: hypothetical protein AUJ18_09275 [Candidatus Hydrogenedentes bacterium CG1_02_42_14]